MSILVDTKLYVKVQNTNICTLQCSTLTIITRYVLKNNYYSRWDQPIIFNTALLLLEHINKNKCPISGKIFVMLVILLRLQGFSVQCIQTILCFKGLYKLKQYKGVHDCTVLNIWIWQKCDVFILQVKNHDKLYELSLTFIFPPLSIKMNTRYFTATKWYSSVRSNWQNFGFTSSTNQQ